MPVTIEANGETFEFEDGTTDEQIGAALDEYFSQSAQPQQGAIGLNEEPEKFGEQEGVFKSALIGLGDGFTRFGEGIQQIHNDLQGSLDRRRTSSRTDQETLNLGLEADAREQEFNQKVQARRDEFANTKVSDNISSKAGSFVGEVAPSLLIPGATGNSVRARLLSGVGLNAAASSTTFVEDGQSRLANAITGGAFGALPVGIEQAAPVVSNTIKSIIRGRNVSADDLANRLDDFQEIGDTPTLGTASQNNTVQGLETISARFFGGEPLRRSVQQTSERTQARLQEIANDLSTRDGADLAGNTIRQGITGQGGFIERFQARAGVLFDEVDQAVGADTVVNVASTRQALDEIVNDTEVGQLITSQRFRDFQQALDTPENVNYETLRALRTFVGEGLSTNELVSGATRGQLRRLYAGLSEDIQEAATNAGAQQAFARANRFYSAGNTRIDNFLEKLNKKVDPEDIFKMVSRGSDSAATINAVKRSLTREEWDVVSSNVIRRLGRSNSSQQDAIGESFSINKFLTDWDKLGNAKNALFSGSSQLNAYRANLDRIARVAEDMKSSSRALQNASGTGAFTANAGAVGGAVTATALGRPDAAFGLIALVGANRGAASLMSNQRFVRWLSQSSQVQQRNYPAYIARLAGVANASTAQDAVYINEFLQSITAEESRSQ